MKKKIILTGGGTGGHIWPLIAVAKALASDFEVIYIGQKNSPEEQAANKNNIKFKTITAAKLQGWSTFNPVTWIRQIIGIKQSMVYMSEYQPVAVLAKGGFVAFPVAIAAWLKRVKLIIHESDAIIGRANRFLSLFAFRFLVAFPKNFYPYWSGNKMIRVGIPINDQFQATAMPKTKTVLFMGGSQGSRFLNQMVKESVKKLSKKAKVVHIYGDGNKKEMEEFYQTLDKKTKESYKIISFTSKIAELIKSSSVVVGRAGATSLVEVAKVGRPMVLIPFPYAASQHQKRNAQILAKKGAAKVLYERKTNSKEILSEIDKLLDSKAESEKLSHNLTKFWDIDARGRIVEIIDTIA